MTGGAGWQLEEIDLDHHIVRTKLPAHGGHANKPALEQMVGELSGTPLWQMHVVDNCVGEDGTTRQAIIVRIHHCIADGMALVGVLLSMFDKTPEGAPDEELGPFAQEEGNPWLDLWPCRTTRARA